MGKRIWCAVAVMGMALLTVGCNDDTEDEARERAREAREGAERTADSVAERAEEATRLSATLSGRSEVPGPGDPDGTGAATVNIDASGGRVCYEVSVQGIDRPTGMHIHEGETGSSGDIVVRLTTPASAGSTTNGCAEADRALIGRITAQPGDFYLNVHTDTYPQGAVRGQLSR